VCCSVLQCVAVYCSVLQCVAGWCSVLPCAAACRSMSQCSPCNVAECCREYVAELQEASCHMCGGLWNVWHDSFIFVTRLTHIWLLYYVTLSYVCHDSLILVYFTCSREVVLAPWLVWGGPLHVGPDSFTCVTWLIYTQNAPHECTTTLLHEYINRCDIYRSNKSTLPLKQVYFTTQISWFCYLLLDEKEF